MSGIENESEIECPACGKPFKTENEMLEHYDKHIEEAKDEPQENIKEEIKSGKNWEFPSKYLGGFTAFPDEAKGYVYLYSEPDNKVVFESGTVKFKIPFSKIKNSKIVTKKGAQSTTGFPSRFISFCLEKEA